MLAQLLYFHTTGCVTLLLFSHSSFGQPSFSFENSACHFAGDELVLIAQELSSNTVSSIEWYFSGQIAGNIIVVESSCSTFGLPDPGYPVSRMTYDCDSGTKTYKVIISNLDGTEDGEWGVKFAYSDLTTSSLETASFQLCEKCDLQPFDHGQVNASLPVTPGSVIIFVCDADYGLDGETALTCQTNGEWNFPWPKCIQCSVQTVENGDVNTTQTSVIPATTIGITCRQGYTLEGSNVLICQNNGQWNLQWPTCNRPIPPRPKCCCICCFILLILNVVLNVVLVLVHVILTWQKHEFSVKKIYSGNNETNEAVCFKDYGIKAALPECCVCVVTIVIQIAVYFAALIQKDCGDSCDKCCEVVICLVVTIIVSIVEAAAGSGIIYIFVNVKGCNYVDQAGQPVPTSNGQVNANNTELSAKM